ncbi:MAG: alpha/beta fold hydrolase [Acidobacteriota bacterium]|nr:alpha/beta fold hydrolase [Acidobacteriota bacterium]
MAEFLHEPANFDGSGVILTHGAGGNCQSPLLVAVADALASAGSLVIRYDLPFREQGKGGAFTPARTAADRAGIREKIEKIRTLAAGPVVMAGHSYGGRQSSLLAAEQPGLADGLLLLSYPLHPPGKPAQLRTDHFPSLRTPALFVSGTRDEFGTPHELTSALQSIPAKTRLISIEKAGHDLARGKFDIPSAVAALRELLRL